MESTWGFSTDGVITAPTISMRDLDKACEQLDWLFERGCKAISICPGPAYGRSPGDPYFDPFWARINEARAVVCYHIAEFYYQSNVAADWGWGLVPPFQFSAFERETPRVAPTLGQHTQAVLRWLADD